MKTFYIIYASSLYKWNFPMENDVLVIAYSNITTLFIDNRFCLGDIYEVLTI